MIQKKGHYSLIHADYEKFERRTGVCRIATSNMGKKYVPLVDWKPSTPNPSSFQVPPREKKAIKITKPSGADILSLQQSGEKDSKTLTPASHCSDKPIFKSIENIESKKPLTTSDTRIDDVKEFSKASSFRAPGIVSSSISQKPAKSE